MRYITKAAELLLSGDVSSRRRIQSGAKYVSDTVAVKVSDLLEAVHDLTQSENETL